MNENNEVQGLLDALDDTVGDLITKVFAQGRKFEEERHWQFLNRSQTWDTTKHKAFHDGVEWENRNIRLAIEARCEREHSALDGCACMLFSIFIGKIHDVPKV